MASISSSLYFEVIYMVVCPNKLYKGTLMKKFQTSKNPDTIPDLLLGLKIKEKSESQNLTNV
jgi:hypothetical protein